MLMLQCSSSALMHFMLPHVLLSTTASFQFPVNFESDSFGVETLHNVCGLAWDYRRKKQRATGDIRRRMLQADA